MEDLRIISRVARRVEAAEVPVGRGFYIGKDSTIHVHRSSGHLQVRDLTLAGKRGKSVPEITIVLNEYYYKGNPEEWFETTMDQLAKCDTWADVKKVAAEAKETKPDHSVVIHEQTIKAIEVAPAGSEIKFKTLAGDDISASPVEFSVIHRFWFGRVEGDPKKPGFAQDTGYWSNNKQSAAIFYAYLKDNMSKVMKMDIQELRNLWSELKVSYRYH
jgi:hypothetical protein